MPKSNGKSLSYASKSACIADARRKGVSAAPCDAIRSGQTAAPGGTKGAVRRPTDMGTPNYPGNPRASKRGRQY